MLVCDFRVEIGNEVITPRFASDHGITVLYGASGAGKTVTLKAIAGLLRPTAGRIVLDEQMLFDAARNVNLPPGRRNVGYVPQSLALLPHMSVAENIGFGVSRGSAVRRRRVTELIEQLGLVGLDRRMPSTLSGGQQQRVALARALARDARLLLLDEPFSALDESLREGMRRELIRLREELGLSIVFVTHDLREAHLLADQLAVFDAGRLLQIGDREDVFRRPSTRRVAELTGVSNILAGTVRDIDSRGLIVDTSGFVLSCPPPVELVSASRGDTVDVAIRAERVNLRRGLAAELDGRNIVDAEVIEDLAYGSTHTLRMRPVVGGPDLTVEIAARPYEILGVAGRRKWAVELPPSDLHVMPAQPAPGGLMADAHTA
jgi:molybdate transport system ATP-binding protein